MSAKADVSFLGVAAGDASSTTAVLWTRAVDTNAPAAAMLTAQVSTDAGFSTSVSTFSVSTDATKDYTAKTTAGGLASNTRYYYRFVDSLNTNNVSITGTFKTAPDSNSATSLHFGFSGDCDGLIRPYDLASVFPAQNLDFFAFLGDTIYETASTGSAAVTSTASATKAQLASQFCHQISRTVPARACRRPELPPAVFCIPR